MHAAPAARQPAPLLARGALGLRRRVRPDAFGNALGESLAYGSLSASGANGSSYAQDDAATRFGPSAEQTFPDLSAMGGGGEFGDGYASSSFGPDVLFAAGDKFTMGLSPAERAKLPVPRDLTEKLGRTIAINDSLADLHNQLATERGLRNIGEMADAYRESGMTGATGDPVEFAFSDGRDARDIRQSFAYQSRVSQELSALASTQAAAGPIWNMRDASAGLRGRAQPSSFAYGFYLGDRSVLDGVEVTTGETVGRALGSMWSGFKDTVYTMTGARAADAARANWSAGNYGASALHGVQSLADAGLMVLGLGEVRVPVIAAQELATPRFLRLPKTDPQLAGTGTLGYTLPNGSVYLQPGLPRVQQVETLRHEGVHAFLSVTDDATFALPRQSLGMWGYNNSNLLRWGEEALAQGIATRSFIEGVKFPIVNPYGISIPRLGAEGAIVGGGIFGSWYGTYRLSTADE